MNARRFDALTLALSAGRRPLGRRSVLRGFAALAATSLIPNVASAFDGGVAPVQVPVGGVACISGVDCAAGEICLNGVCAPRGAIAVGDSGTTAVTPPSGVGGLIQPGVPLPARIYAGRCGQLGAEPAFQLIDVGSLEGIEEGEAPEGALTAIPAEFSTTVVNTTLADLLASDFAIDIRVDDADPATSIACGDIGGPVEAGPDGTELAVGLQERGQSAYAGIALLQDEGERTLVRVFLARGLGGEDTVTVAQTAPADVVEAPAPEPAPADSAEVAEAAATPAAGQAGPIGAGTRVLTTIDVNLRAEPNEEGPVLTILGTGVELEVTGAPENGWVPVIEPASGQRGFVSDQFVTIAS